MPGPLLRSLAAAACAALIGATAANAESDADRGMGRSDDPIARAQSDTEWPLHTALEGERRPFLCKGRDSVGVIVDIMAQAFGFQDKDADKAKRILEIASRLQGELCTRPTKDDIVILRCNLAQRDTASAKISTVKVSAVLRAEPSKGEQPFYAWTYRNITSNSGDPAEARSASSRWCSESDDGDEAVNPTSDVVITAQTKMYDLGMRVTQINGAMTPEMTQLLVDFQKWAGLPPTGQLTKRTMQALSTVTLPSAWVALAFDGNGNFGSDTGATRRGAEASALEKLQRVSRSSYKISSIAGACIAIATTRYVDRRQRTTFTQAFTSAGPSSAAAKENVMAYCEREKDGGNCELRHALCATQSQEQVKRYDKNSIPVNAQPPNQRFNPSNIPANSPNPNPSTRYVPENPPLNTLVPESR
ncbi:MAG: hypothetical protein C5B56_02760 [Proteobacteria bacterium]|nr:MAG: hypothetical protein C5B56_02760 [Pseudomonadota bacterium]